MRQELSCYTPTITHQLIISMELSSLSSRPRAQSAVFVVVLAGLFFLASFYALGYQVKKINESAAKVSINGKKTIDVVSDRATYTATLSLEQNTTQAKQTYTDFDQKVATFISHMQSEYNIGDPDTIEKNFVSEQVSPAYTDSQTRIAYPSKTRLIQSVTIISKDVKKIKKLAESRGLLTQAGFDFYYDPAIAFEYTQLPELRKTLLKQATDDAKDRAKAIASNTGQSVGKLVDIDSGSVSVYAKGKEDDEGWSTYNKDTIDKTVSVVVRATFELE
jgi:hypothetical protein